MDWETYSALGLSSVGNAHSNNPGVESEDPAARRAEAEADETYWDRIVNPNSKHESRARRPGAPSGRIIEHKGWASSTVYPGTVRDWWIYVPAQYDSTGPPAALLVCQDGNLPTETGPNDPFPHGQITLDNLIYSGEIPITIAVFIGPGAVPPEAGFTYQRSIEYSTLDGTYGKFLERDILPIVEADYNISRDPALRIATGGSEGGICAFALGWFRPDLFGKVLSWVGAFVNIRGGHHLPWLIRNTPRKSIVVWLADGVNDSNSQHGSLPLANEQMASALEYSEYTYRIEWGQGGHSPKHQASLLPEALRWLFATPAAPPVKLPAPVTTSKI